MSNFQCNCSSKLYRKQNFQVLTPIVNCVTFAARPAVVPPPPRGTKRKSGEGMSYPTRPQVAPPITWHLERLSDCCWQPRSVLAVDSIRFCQFRKTVLNNDEKRRKLEIWDRAQREAARRCKSDKGQFRGGGVKIPLVGTSRVPNAVPLAYAARAVLILGGSKCAPITFLLVEQSFVTERGRDRSWLYFFLAFDMSVSSGDIRDQSLKLSEIAPNFGRFLPSKF